MVFENVVSQILNKVLGDFVENLDGNQLNIGIWGGDINLKDLVLKSSALNALDLPVQVVYGKIGNLVLKVPWKSLYTQPTIVIVEDIYLLAQPNLQVTYDPVKEDKSIIEARTKEIEKIENAKKAEKEKDQAPADPGFVQKAIQQAIKNVQINIKNIHLRYEDKVTNPKQPFAFGITLSELLVESTDSNWKKAIIEDVAKIYKVVQLDGLAVYWNCKAKMYSNLAPGDLVAAMKKEISTKTHKPQCSYILGPISAGARLRMNQKPTEDKKPYSIPIYHLNLDMGKLFIGISKSQYRDIIALADSMDRMAKGVPYRKYRPNVNSYRGHYKVWWKFAYKCVVEGEVKRQRQNWDWNHMKAHRKMGKEYGELYKKNLKNACSEADKARITDCEKRLDLTSIVIIRQRIEMETERLQKQLAKTQKKGWMTGWFKGSSTSTEYDDSSKSDLLKQFEKEMTPEEKARLYKAIGYQENAEIAVYPEDFVDKSLSFLLRTLEIELRDDDNDVKTILLSSLKGVKVKLETRVSASALKAHVAIDHLKTDGLKQEDFLPVLFSPEERIVKGVKSLLDVTFETNPLDKSCDQRINLVAKPLKIIYDAQTINKVIDIFKIPPDSSLDQLSAAASDKLTDVKQMTSTGLQYAIEQHNRLDLDILLHAPLIIIPYGGKYEEIQNVLVVDLGTVKVYSAGHRSSIADVKKLYKEGMAQEEIFEKMTKHSYDRFKMDLSDLQIMIAQSEENWRECIEHHNISDMHLLRPFSLSVEYSKCLILDDPRLPHTKITCDLPSIDICISDARLLLLVTLVTSIPFPTSDDDELESSLGPLNKKLSASRTSLLKQIQDVNIAAPKALSKVASSTSTSATQFQLMVMSVCLSEIRFTLNQQETLQSPQHELATFKVLSLQASLLQRTFDMKVSLLLGGISLTQNRNDSVINIISTPLEYTSSDSCLFKVEYTQVDTKSPEFKTVHQLCETCLTVDFSILTVQLHQEALLLLIEFAQSLQNSVTDITSSSGPVPLARRLSIASNLSDFGKETSKTLLSRQRRQVDSVVESIKIKIKARIEEVKVNFSTDSLNIASIAFRDLNAEVIVKTTYTQVMANLRELSVMDLNPETKHSAILKTEADDALTVLVVLNNLEGESYKPDIDVQVKMGGTRIVFVNWFVTNFLGFLNQFQAAQQAIVEASEVAAQKAKENAKEMYQKATKIQLQINLRAPKILVPASSQSTDALLLDLGIISISNRFNVLDIKNKEGYSAVVDDMNIALTNLIQSKVKLDSNEAILQETNILEPINFEIKVKRNLSAAWYKSIPDIEVGGKIKSICLHLSQADYQMIMSVLNENLQEGKAASPPEEIKVTSTTTVTTRATLESGISLVSREDKSGAKEKPHIFLQFTFTMDHLILNLYSGGFKSNVKSTPDKKADNHLGRFSLEGFAVKGKILSDDSLVASILLVNCLLDDMRKGREDKLNRLIERSMNDDSVSLHSDSGIPSSRSMIDITYQQSGNDMFADVRIFSFTLILSVEYLMKLADFFGDTEKKAKAPVEVKSTNAAAKKPSKVSIEEAQPKSSSQITLSLKIEKPDIILVEHMNNINTNAMILNAEVVLKFRMNGDHQVVNGLIKDLQLYTCKYNPALRAESRGNILHPVTISLAGSTPEDKGLHIELVVEAVILRVSPATIELLNRVLATMSEQPATGGDDVEETNFQHIWDVKPFKDNDFWFLKSDMAEEATEQVMEYIPEKKTLQEICIISMSSLVITVEAGVGNKTLPMLLFETTLKGSAKNWSSQLSVEAGITVQMGYYNSRLALWEPLIEPVERKRNGKLTFEPWELKLELSMNEPDDSLNFSSPTSEEQVEIVNQPPVMSIDFTSEKTLEMTVTKTCLEVLNNLGKAFASAMKSEEKISSSDVLAPYRVLNEIGEDITLLLHESSFNVAAGGSLEDINRSAAVPLVLKDAPTDEIQLDKELNRSAQEKEYFLQVKVNKTDCELTLPVMRADKRFFSLNYTKDNNNWGVISDVKVDAGVTLVTIRSILQVYNHFSVPVDVYYMTEKGNELELVGSVEPNSVLDLPLKAVYTPTNELFFSVSGYSVTTAPYIWKDLQTNLNIVKILHCPILKDMEYTGKYPFILKAIGEMEQVYYANTMRHTMASTCFNIHLRPAAILKNFLPLPIIVCIDELADELEVKAGDTLQLPNVDPGKSVIVIRLPEYLEKEWSCRKESETNPQEFNVWTFDSYDSPTKMSLDLGMHTINKNGSLIYSLYCPFWMLNKTGLMLGYRSSDENLNVLHHPADFKGPILFSFNARNFFGKKKSSIRVESGDWSDKFSLDVAGSSGVVHCKSNDKIYQIGVHNQLTYNNLTKQVTFTPYYVIINEAPFAIECQESNRPADSWVKVEPKSCSALWPKSDVEDKLLKLRIVGTKETSAPFLYTESHTTLLKLNNKHGGVNVDIQLNEGAVYINFAPYTAGSAPALIINHCGSDMNFWEKQSVQIRTLKPKTSLLYTWENPSGSRTILWEKAHKIEIENDLRKDGCGSFQISESHQVYWTSFLDGMQRILLFTDNSSLAQSATNILEIIQQEITLTLHGVGLSLVNNETRQEIMYIGIASSGVIWETCKPNKKRYKPLGIAESTHIENAYQHYLIQQLDSDSSISGTVLIDNKIEVDFESKQMFKPRRRTLRRTFQTGVWLQMKTSPSQTQLHAKINRLQIDNQMYDCIFPVVLAPVPPPKSVAADSGIKPFLELSIVQMILKNSQIKQFKYFKVLIQEFHIKVDLGFVNAIVALLGEQAAKSDEEDRELFETDMKLVDQALYSHASSQVLQGQKSFYDLLHFSPLKIHVSFSLAEGSSGGQNASTPNFLNVLLQGVGVTLTDLQDVVFKLAFFERDYIFLTQSQLTAEATNHYIGQLIKQLYVLVLGLDVLGNPYGLVVGLTKGVEDLFYEPFQGAIQGPSEFAEGLALGVKSLLGHTVGGVMGAATRITGAMGKGIAALTFDDEFQRKRREQINKKPATAQEGIARSGKGLVMGVFDGVTGVFTKPVAGAKEQGVEGFFKGLGKGAVGLVARPAAGIVDFASGSLDVVKRYADVSEDTLRLRPPRFIPSDGLVRSYNSFEAEGHKLLMELSKGKYAKTDIYVFHAVVIEKKEILLLTDKRMAYITHNDLFGGWQVDWSYTWQELKQPARVVPKGVSISTADTKKKKLFGSNDTIKTILISNPATKEELCAKIEGLRSA